MLINKYIFEFKIPVNNKFGMKFFDSYQNINKHINFSLKVDILMNFEVILKVFVLVIGHKQMYFFTVYFLMINMFYYMRMINCFH